MEQLIQKFGEDEVLYGVFGFFIGVFLILDLGVLMRVTKKMTVRSAVIQSVGWVSIALLFGYLIYHYEGSEKGLQYISAYLMEYSLSTDNLFVFIIILTYFKISEKYYQRVLYFGIIGAVIFRVIFILVGIVVVSKFEWILYIFGLILVYTGVNILRAGGENEFDPAKNLAYKFLRRYLPLLDNEGEGKFTLIRNGKRYFSILFVVFVIIATTDIVFALDSIPAVFAISQDRMVIITSNVFAVMGLRAMFYLLSHVANKFRYLQEGIAIVLIFIGVKMLIEIFNWHISTQISLIVIASVLITAIVISIFFQKRKPKNEN